MNKKRTDVTELNKEYIENQFHDKIKKLDGQISVIETRQQEIQSYITTINQGIQQLEYMINQEANKQNKQNINWKSISVWQKQIHENMELITKLYDTYRSFEDVKLKYYKEMDDHSIDTYKLSIEIRKVNEKLGSLDAAGFVDILQHITTQMNNINNESETPEIISSVNKELIDNEDYSL